MLDGVFVAAAKDLGLRGDEAAKVRKLVGDLGQRALAKLSDELELYKPVASKRVRGRGVSIEDAAANFVPVHWVERFAKLADQLRRDYVIDESAEPQPQSQLDEPPEERLKRLKVV